MAEHKGITVYCEIRDGKLLPIATEGLGIGRKLADDLGQELVAVLIGSNIGSLAEQAIACGADKAYVYPSYRSPRPGCHLFLHRFARNIISEQYPDKRFPSFENHVIGSRGLFKVENMGR